MLPRLFLVFLYTLNQVNGCTFPSNLVGTFLDSTKGLVTFNSTNIDGYPIANLGSFQFTCYQSSSSQYILKSNTFKYFDLTWRAYLCWDVTEVASDQFYYYARSNRLSDAGNERVKMYLEGFAIDVADICALSTGVTGTYRYLLKNESISTANTTCPSALQSYFTYSADFGSNDTCSGNTTQLDGCTSSTALSYNYSAGCSTLMSYSTSGTVTCLYNLIANNLNYMTLINKQYTPGQNDTYYFTCMVIDTSSTSTIYATQYPQQCQDNQTSTYVQTPGAALIFTYNGSCVIPTTEVPTTTAASANITTITLATVFTILLIFIIVVIALCYVNYNKQLEAAQRKLEDRRAQDTVDGRYNEDDDIFGERGKAPPHLRITFPDYTKRAIKNGKVGVQTSYGFDDWDGVDMIYSNGLEPVTPSGVYPRTMEDRANKEERMSNDSALGMEEDYIPPITGTPEVRTNHEVNAFRRVHGRQQFRSEAALVDSSNPMNLVKKIKKLAKKKKRKPSEIYQSPDPAPQSGRSEVSKHSSDPNYVMGIGKGAEADRGRDAKRRDTHPDVNSSSRVQPLSNTNSAYDDQVDTSAVQSGKRFKQDEDVSKLLAGTVLNDVEASPRTNHQQRRRKPSKGVHYSPRSPGVIMEDLEDQVSKKYAEGYLSPAEQEHPDSNAAKSVNNRANAYVYTEDDKNGTRDRVSVTPGMKIRRYENGGDGMDPNESSTLSARNQSNYIQRLNRKNPKRLSSNRLTKSAGSPSLPELQRRGMTDDKYRKLLEELYPDKKYFDYTKKSAGPSEEYLSNKTNEGLEYLHGCAEYWENHESPQRPHSTPSKSKGSKSARGQTTTRISSGLSRNHSIHTSEMTSEGFPPNVS